MLKVGGSGSGTTNDLVHLINHQSHIHMIHLYVKDPYRSKYQFLSNKQRDIGLKSFKDLTGFIE